MVELMRRKKAQAAKKQAAILVQLREEIARQTSAAEAAVQADVAAAEAGVTHKLAAIQAAMDKKMAEIDAATASFQQTVNQLWEEYVSLYDSRTPVIKEAHERGGASQAAHKRRFSELEEGVAGLVAEAERRMARVAKKAHTMPEVASVMMNFL